MPVRNEADPRWDSLKSTIESLYLEKHLEGTEGLMETMAKDYRFSKTKSQYESQFKIWGIRKYRKKDDWKSIGRNIAERKRAGKESDVYINGKLIPKSKVQKETRRHGSVTALEQNRPAPIPPIPDGFEIRTPAAEEIVQSTRLEDTTPWTEMDVSAISELQQRSPSLQPEIRANDVLLAQLPSVNPFSLPWAGTDEFPFSPIEDIDHYFERWTHNLPFFQLEYCLCSQFTLPLTSTSIGSDMILETILLPENPHEDSYEVVDVIHELLKRPEMRNAALKALLPNAARVVQAKDQMIPSPNHDRSDSASYELFTLLIFSMANNFAGLNSVPIQEIMVFLNCHASTRLLQQLFRTSGPESEAFAEKLFSAAIWMKDVRIVKVLLQKGLVPNDLVCVHNGEKYTPLEYSSVIRNVEITRLLLDAKLDVNRSIASPRGAIACAIYGQWWHRECRHEDVPLELVDMLLEAGCNFSWLELEFKALKDNPKVLDLLLDNSFKAKTYEEAWHLFIKSFRGCDNATATRIYTRFLKAGVTIDQSFRHDSDIEGPFRFPIDIAAERGNLELVQLLLRSGASSTMETLTCAIRGRSKELTKFLFDDGVDVSAFGESATEHVVEVPSPAPSPLSEAIRWGDPEILDLLEEKGAWSRIVNKVTTLGEFEDVLIAASVQRQLTTVQKLLQYRPPNTHGRDLSDALVAAIYLNEDVIVQTLLDAGANVNGGLYEVSDVDAAVKGGFDGASSIDSVADKDYRERPHRGPALVEALLQKNERLVRLILDADVYFTSSRLYRGRRSKTPLEAAVEWGNLSIIEEVIPMDAQNEWDALAIAVRRKDPECAQLLINAGVPVGIDALSIAVKNNDMEMVEYLFSVGAEPADSDALSEATALPNGLLMMKRLLTEFSRRYPHGRPRYNPRYGSEIFRKAIEEGDFDLVELFLNAKAIVKSDIQIEHWHHENDFRSLIHGLTDCKLTLLGDAILPRHTTSNAILQRLLNEVGNPNVIVHTSEGNTSYIRETALLVAIDRRDISKVQLLIDAGADVNWHATKGVKRTPLQKAAEIGSFEISQLLINQGGLVNNEPAVRGGATAIQLAAIGGYIGIAELLLANDADVNAPAAKFYGRTALEGAAEHGRIDMLKLLCNAGAVFKGTEYETARELAKENGHMATWRYLESLYPSSEMTSMDD